MIIVIHRANKILINKKIKILILLYILSQFTVIIEFTFVRQ